ncbi:MAG: TetR/AcrR family transcriptional regulator, partial [Ginsengibacter sp.]
MRVSNITYYFPTKDDLVLAIAEQLRNVNNPAFTSADISNVVDFLKMYRTIFYNQYAYRCLHLSFVHLITQNAVMAKDYKRVESKRREQIIGHLLMLIKNGELQKMNDEQLKLLIGNITLLSRFWISEGRISYSNFSADQQVEHYIKVLGNFLFGYATAKGKRSINFFYREK